MLRTRCLLPFHAALLGLAACGPAPPAFGLQHFGVMREVMMEGKTEARVDLSLYQHKGCYAVGALAGLAGEVMVDDGVVYTSRDRAEAIDDHAGDSRATLFTVARVPTWREVPLAADATLEAIEQAILLASGDALLLQPAPLPTPSPVPFLVIAPAATIEMHVVRGSCPHGATDPEHQPSIWHSDAKDAASTRVVGFFAPGQAGVMTHHGTAIHAHAMTTNGHGTRAMGHVDRLLAGPGARLLLPAVARP